MEACGGGDRAGRRWRGLNAASQHPGAQVSATLSKQSGCLHVQDVAGGIEVVHKLLRPCGGQKRGVIACVRVSPEGTGGSRAIGSSVEGLAAQCTQ